MMQVVADGNHMIFRRVPKLYQDESGGVIGDYFEADKDTRVGERMRIGKGVRLVGAVLGQRATLGDYVHIYYSTIGSGAKLGDGVGIDDLTAGDGCSIGASSIVAHECVIGDDFETGHDSFVYYSTFGDAVHIGHSFECYGEEHRHVTVGHRCTIGDRVVINAGYSLPDDSVVPDDTELP